MPGILRLPGIGRLPGILRLAWILRLPWIRRLLRIGRLIRIVRSYAARLFGAGQNPIAWPAVGHVEPRRNLTGIGGSASDRRGARL